MNLALAERAGHPLEAPPLDLHALVRRLFPLPRSLSGDGVRQTLAILAEHIPLQVREIASGTAVLDWEVPPEWTLRSARICSLDGRVVVDAADCNLHVVGYSVPVDAQLTREQLAAHVHTLPEQPTLVPYRTGYFANDWGFCLSQQQWDGMRDDAYQVRIDSTLGPGAISLGELFLPGSEDAEVLVSVHTCHPSLANDNLSGIALATALALRMAARPRRFGYRFLFMPATIGAIAWLAHNEARLPRIEHGLVLTCLGDAGPFHYKRSRSGAPIDRAVAHVLAHLPYPHALLPFHPYGYDERQYGSPGFDLPVGCLMRGVHGQFPQYHTSADDLAFVTAAALAQSYGVLATLVDLLEANRHYQRVDGRGEPQLGRRGLYRAIAGQRDAGGASQMDLLWLLNLADGRHSLLDIAERAQRPFASIAAAAQLALQAELVRACAPPSASPTIQRGLA
jgi:aminopeptidase-like protein